MTNSFLQTIAATPWWIYFFSVYFIYIAFLTTKPRLVSIKSLFFMPICFTALSVISMCIMQQVITFTHISIWLGTLFLGTGLGYLQMRIFNIHAVQTIQSLYLPGTWTIFMIMIVSFVTAFYSGFSFNPQMLLDPTHAVLLVFIYGLLTGFFTGRLGYGLRCMQSGPFKNQDSIALT